MTTDPQVLDGTITLDPAKRYEFTVSADPVVTVIPLLTFAELRAEQEATSDAYRHVLLFMLTVLAIAGMFALPAIYAVLS